MINVPHIAIGILYECVGVTCHLLGAYSVLIDQSVWFASAATRFRVDGKWYSSSDSTLKLVSGSNYTGCDGIGTFESSVLNWRVRLNVDRECMESIFFKVIAFTQDRF